MQIALRLKQGPMGRLIAWQTRSGYDHAALVFSDGVVFESAAPRGVVSHMGLGPGVWDVYELGLTAAGEEDVRQFAERQVGKGYDYTMVARFVTRRQESRASSGKWFCSEYVFASVGKVLALLARTEPWEVSPGLLARSTWLRQGSRVRIKDKG